MEMMHVMLKYPEVVTNLEFIHITTLLLELRVGIIIETYSNTDLEYGAYAHTIIDNIPNSAYILTWIMHNPNQLFIMDDLKWIKVSVDKIT